MKPDDKSARKKTSKPSKPEASSKPAVLAAAESAAKPDAKAKPKAAPRKISTAPIIPAILLEGDKPTTAPAAGPGERYALGPVPPPEHLGRTETRGELPEAYGTEQLFLAARDPHWLYARWDLTQQQQRKYNSFSTDKHLVLRIFINEAKGQPFATVHVHPESTHWFVHVANAATKYVAELGYFRNDGKWETISTSGATLTPPDTMSDDSTVQFATIPIEIPFTQLMQLARTAVQQNIPLAEVLQQLRASGYNFPPAKPGEKWTPEKETALAAIISMDRVRRVWMGSIEITELIRRQLQQEMSSMGVAQFGGLSSELGGISSVTSVSSPFGAAQERKKGFWFNVNAELIIYGATEPDAHVSIGGRAIKLRPDGTFSFRFKLPDGEYELPAVAISNDKTDGRAAELKFSRATEYRGDVGQHPQDAQLRPPLAEHVA